MSTPATPLFCAPKSRAPHSCVKHILHSCLAGAMALMLAAPGLALEDDSALTLRGFGTLGVAHNREDGADYIRDITQPGGIKGSSSGHLDSRLGVQLDLNLPHNLAATAQVVSRYRYDGTYKPELAWGFVKYSPSESLDLRVGRLGWDVYMLADSRDVGYSYLWVRPPVDYYGALQFSKLNGADVVFRKALNHGILTAKLFAGRAVGNLAANDTTYSNADDTSLVGGYLNYELGAWQFRFGYTDIDIDNELRGDGAEQFRQLKHLGEFGAFLASTTRGKVGSWTIGSTYDQGPVQGQLMFTYSDNKSESIPDWRSGYASLGYRSGKWTPFITYAVNTAGSLPSAPPVPPGLQLPPDTLTELGSFTGGVIPDQSTFSVGVRYDFSTNMALKFQYDHVNVREAGRRLTLWRDIEPDWNGRARIFTATLDFIF